jgi:hypothetical protein
MSCGVNRIGAFRSIVFLPLTAILFWLIDRTAFWEGLVAVILRSGDGAGHLTAGVCVEGLM